MDNLPYCYFPSKIVCIDDSLDALDAIKMNLDRSIASYQFFHNPMDALDYLNKKEKISLLFDRVIETSGYPVDEKVIYNLYQEIYNSQRYEVISTIIVDYEMPGMTGLELCRQIKDSSIKKILLTGLAEEEHVIEAFNKGIIDFYIRKHDPHAYDKLEQYVYEAQHKYFNSLTEVHINSILKNWNAYDKDITALYDPIFINFFKGFIKEHQINEYYLIDLTGSFLYLTETGKVGALFVYNEEKLEENYEVLEDFLDSSLNISKEIIRDLKQHRKILCFPFIAEAKNPDEDCDKYIYPLQTLEGQRRYYIAHATEIDYLNKDKILSFNQYKKSLTP